MSIILANRNISNIRYIFNANVVFSILIMYLHKKQYYKNRDKEIFCSAISTAQKLALHHK